MDSSKMEPKMDMVYMFGPINQVIEVNGKTTNSKEKVNTNGVTAENIPGTSRGTNSMEKGTLCMKMAVFIKANSKTTKNTVKVSILGQTEKQ